MQTSSTPPTLHTTPPAPPTSPPTPPARRAPHPTPTVPPVPPQGQFWARSKRGKTTKREQFLTQKGFAHNLAPPPYHGTAPRINPGNNEPPPLERMHTECQW